jgi:colanic acid/amylovoran biosynthesis glycosyltransferase
MAADAMTADTTTAVARPALFFCVFFPMISETFIFDQMAALRTAGVGLHIVSMWRSPGGAVQETVVQHRLLDTTRFALAARGGAKRAAEALAALARLGRRSPAALGRLLALKRRGRSWNDLAWLALYAVNCPRPGQPVSIVANFGQIGRLAVDLRDIGVIDGPVITYFHGIDVTEIPSRHGAGFYARLFEAGDRFLIASPHFRDQLLAMGCKPDRITYCPVGIDVASFPLRAAPAADPGRPFRLLSVARLTEKKGLGYVLEAVALLAPRFRLTYEVIGDGPLLAALRDRVAELGLAGVVTFHGARTRGDVVAALERADAFVQASITTEKGDQEAIPLSIKEAMARGVPVVATRHGGIPELVLAETNGLLVPERDAEALAQQIGRLIEDGPLRDRIVTAGRAAIERDWDNAVLLPRFVDLIQRT